MSTDNEPTIAPSSLRRCGRSSMMARYLPRWSRSCVNAVLVEPGTTAFGLISPPEHLRHTRAAPRALSRALPATGRPASDGRRHATRNGQPPGAQS
jgi:hypothetical protein